MANYFIFSQTTDCYLEKIAKNENEKDYFLKFFPRGRAVECNDSEFSDVKLGLKICILNTEGNIEIKNNPETYLFTETVDTFVVEKSLEDLQKQFKDNINIQIQAILNSINYNLDYTETDKTDWNTYLSKLKSIDINSVNFPLEKSFQTWFLEQEGVPSKNILELL
jgi:hypothetical protein